MPFADAIKIMTFGVVVFSVVFQGVTMPLLLRKLGHVDS
jgi:NhaP-type Na+/H+ or K+/H+ antiporter